MGLGGLSRSERDLGRFLVKAVLLLSVLLTACASGSRPTPKIAGAEMPVSAPHVSPGNLDASHVLGDLPARAQRLGAGALSLAGSGLAAENDWLGGFVDVPSDDCLLAYARGGPSVTDVDVVVYSDDGAVLAVDEGRDVHPTVVMCPPHPSRVYVAGHVAEGEGPVAVGAQLVPLARAASVAQSLGAHGALEQGSVLADVGPGLDDAIRRHYLELGGKWEEARRLALTVDARVPAYVAITIDANRCVDTFMVPGEEIGSLDAEVLDSDGRTLARSRDGSGPSGIIVCSPVGLTGTLAIRPHVGRGVAAIVFARADSDVYRDISARPEVAWVGPRRSLQAAKKVLEAALSNAGYVAPVATASGVLIPAARTMLPVDLKAATGGACLRIDVTGGEPLSLVQAHLWSDGGSLLASEQTSSSALLFGCAGGLGRLELEASGSAGPFSVTVRPERWKDAAFEALPLAASRMLARAAYGPERVTRDKERYVRVVPLDAANGVSWSEIVPAGRCANLAVGVQGEGAGLEVRAFDGADVELDRAEGPDAVMVRACAPSGAGRLVRFEMRASAGSVKAVVGERLD
jgi:hypothetical protein